MTALAKGMVSAGLRAGDRVGLWSPNYAEWTLVQFATAEIGVIVVNINPSYRTHELAYALNQSECRWIIAAPSFKTSDYRSMTEATRSGHCGPNQNAASPSGATNAPATVP